MSDDGVKVSGTDFGMFAGHDENRWKLLVGTPVENNSLGWGTVEYVDGGQPVIRHAFLLSGHAIMVQEDIKKHRIAIDRETARMLKEIACYSRTLHM